VLSAELRGSLSSYVTLAEIAKARLVSADSDVLADNEYDAHTNTHTCARQLVCWRESHVLISVPACTTYTRKLGWWNVLGRATYILELSHLVQTLHSLTDVTGVCTLKCAYSFPYSRTDRAGSAETIKRYHCTSARAVLWRTFVEVSKTLCTCDS
jgi:hypothetical protein